MHTNDDHPLTVTSAKEATLLHVTAAHRDAEAAIANRRDMIETARGFGATWDEIGAACGMSRQTAHKRFGNGVT